MRVLICGSRNWTDRGPIQSVIEMLPAGSVVIHGAAAGADSLAGQVAYDSGVSVEIYPADWKRDGRAAGPIRNTRMLREGKPDRVIAFRMPGVSRGTDDMIKQSRAAGLMVDVIEGQVP